MKIAQEKVRALEKRRWNRDPSLGRGEEQSRDKADGGLITHDRAGRRDEVRESLPEHKGLSCIE
jgi:hypothetical protein